MSNLILLSSAFSVKTGHNMDLLYDRHKALSTVVYTLDKW